MVAATGMSKIEQLEPKVHGRGRQASGFGRARCQGLAGPVRVVVRAEQ